ncbi:MAG: hypothetical protein J6X69_06180 [Bacteroidales bacterium]|nr:hypothetical protein [Bacteroidales bacterium]
MKKTILIFFFALMAFTAQAGQPGNIRKMGEVIGTDASQASGRSFPKRLFSAKGSWGLGLDGVYLGAKGSDSNLMMLLTGINGGFSFGRVAPMLTYTYADNLAVGFRFTYMGAKGNIDSATALGLADLNMDLSGIGLRLNAYSASVFHRNWFGLDDKGRFGIYLDAALTYQHLRAETSYYGISHRAALSFSPGFEAFVMNFLSLNLSIGLASVYYEFSTVYDKSWQRTGSSNGFHAGTGLSVLDINFGLTFYL